MALQGTQDVDVDPRSILSLKNIEATAQWYSRFDGQYQDALQNGSAAWNKVTLWKGDITKLKVDVIVNAAKESLLGGDGVDRAIHAAAGPKLKEECRKLKHCAPGDAKITEGFNLPAKHVIHTVGPRDYDPEVLRNCYDRCFEIMMKHELRSVAFPCIATGEYHFPNDDAADIALSAARWWLERHHADVKKVVFCVYEDKDFDLYYDKLPMYFSPDDGWNSHSNAKRASNGN